MSSPPPRPRLAAVVAVLVAAGPAAAAPPRDEVLRLAPPDAALLLLVQNARDHARAVAASPFAAWAPSTTLGKLLLGSADTRAARDTAAAFLAELGTTPAEVLDEVAGDAVAFAFSPAPPDRPGDEQGVILVRPRKPDVLARIVDRVNQAQTRSGELKALARREHRGEPYHERQKADGGTEYYCFRGGVFAFSAAEADVRAVIDRSLAPADGPPEPLARMTRLGVADAAAVVLVRPRAFDAELDRTVRAAAGDDRAALERFREVWAAVDAAAAYLDLGKDVEVGMAVRFDPAAVPGRLRGWLVGAKTPSALWAAVPEDALAAASARFRAAELLEVLEALLPPRGKEALRDAVASTVGPVVGRDRLPEVLAALGPDWVAWAEPPAAGGLLPVGVLAVRLDPEKPEAARAVERAVGFGFQAARFAHNARHADQIDLAEEKDGDAVVTTLANPKRFPTGFRPSFAVKGAFLLVATSPDPIRRFRPPAAGPAAPGELTALRVSATALRGYLTVNRDPLAKWLAEVGAGTEADVRGQVDQLNVFLEVVDRAEVVVRGDAAGLRVALRVRLAKPLK